jgi:hypothetical protein
MRGWFVHTKSVVVDTDDLCSVRKATGSRAAATL